KAREAASSAPPAAGSPGREAEPGGDAAAPAGVDSPGREDDVSVEASATATFPVEDLEPEERCTIRFALPPPVIAALDEARDLHSAISGGQTTLISFIEALVAEACAGSAAPLIDDDWRGRRLDQASR